MYIRARYITKLTHLDFQFVTHGDQRMNLCRPVFESRAAPACDLKLEYYLFKGEKGENAVLHGFNRNIVLTCQG